MDKRHGVQITSLLRGLLMEYGHDHKTAERITERFQEEVRSARWLSLDDGQTYDLTFVPKEI